jgi:anion-transporting  ArsA/GET3 family ATPase
MALDWTRQLMRIIVKYRHRRRRRRCRRVAARAARELRALQRTLHDPDRTAVVIVTLDEPMVRAETQRLAEALQEAGVRVVVASS